MNDDAIFSTLPPIPVRHSGKTPPPEVEEKQKRKYTRKPKAEQPKSTPVADNKQDAAEDVMLVVEALFEPTQVTDYYMIKSFIELHEMVAPENRKRLAMILEGLISK